MLGFDVFREGIAVECGILGAQLVFKVEADVVIRVACPASFAVTVNTAVLFVVENKWGVEIIRQAQMAQCFCAGVCG